MEDNFLVQVGESNQRRGTTGLVMVTNEENLTRKEIGCSLGYFELVLFSLPSFILIW